MGAQRQMEKLEFPDMRERRRTYRPAAFPQGQQFLGQLINDNQLNFLYAQHYRTAGNGPRTIAFIGRRT